MLPAFSLSVAFLSLLFSITTGATSSYTPTDNILLNCGSSSITTSLDGRNWVGDTNSKFSPDNLDKISFLSAPSEQNSAVSQAPYMTARIIMRPFTYSFPISPGPKFVRLYFYPSSYSTFNISSSFFSVTANQYTLLSNFSAFLTIEATYPREFTIVREYVVNVLENQHLNVTISPNSSSSYAFINGIEIVSIPDTLYRKPGQGSSVKFVSPNGIEIVSTFEINNTTAMENVQRVNVGGKDISAPDDTGMYRSWRSDDQYLFGAAEGKTSNLDIPVHYTNTTPAYVAPEIVYTTSRTMGVDNMNHNLTWIFPVDSGFYYLVRLHFCEFMQRVFAIYLSNQTAEEQMDVIHRSGGRGIPVYKDYVIQVLDRDGRRRSKLDMWLVLHPMKAMSQDALLNGVEIFKLNQSDASLAGSNPDPSVKDKKQSSPVKGVIGGVIGCVLVFLFIVGIFIFRRRRMGKLAGGSGSETKMSPLPSDLCRRFSISDIRTATSNFHENFVIGSGGFGNVYKGYVDDGSTGVAIKRLNPSSKQGVQEFETEIKVLSKLRHLNLVSLIGYSDDKGEMVLVYDYMANGTLRDHLYKTKKPPLSWKTRLDICIGAARGLHYLHAGVKDTIIHRDVKSTNILLDENWVAKVSDFGISKIGPSTMSQTHVSTLVKGSFGYIDPEYFMKQQLTEKSDVYSFGVVLLEVLCGRPAVTQGVPFEQVSLAEWGKNCNRDGTLDEIVDKNVSGEISAECLKEFAEIACSCVRDKGIERPTMGDVVRNLEFALQLQDSTTSLRMYPNTTRGVLSSIHNDEDFMNKTGTESVFSDIQNPKGR